MTPSTPPTAPIDQTTAPRHVMPADNAMNGDMMNNIGAMMKSMSPMMDKMSGMMKGMGTTAGGPDKSGAAPAVGCGCCEKMVSGMALMGGASGMAKTPAIRPAPAADEAAPAPAAGNTATDHSAHH